MKIGITGSRVGPVSDEQSNALHATLKTYRAQINDFFHGCCIGVDEEATMLAFDLKYHIVGFPPINKKLASDVAMSLSHELRPEAEYLERDRAIVEASDLLLVVPKSFNKEMKSGTWYTYRYAILVNTPRLIIWPDGSMETEGTVKVPS